VYQDPINDASGREAVMELIADFHKRRPGVRFDIASGVDHHHGKLYYLWKMFGADGQMLIEGFDYGELDTEGRFRCIMFLLSEARIPVWWTQQPADLPVLTGWFGGPKTAGMAYLDEQELIEAGLSGIFGRDPKELMRGLIAARAINWAQDRFTRGA
jgi:hypothetical protein